jgi:colanic acid biosynthesis glycosyl transferase WcaI
MFVGSKNVVHILTQQAGAADLVMPSKLLGMLDSRKPVIATANPYTELANLVGQVGIITTPGDVDALVQAILQLEGSPELRKNLGFKSINMVNNNWSQEKVMSDFHRHLL